MRAVEEADRGGQLLSHESRRTASRTAQEAKPRGDGWVANRATALAAELGEGISFLPRLLRWTRPGRGLLLPVGLGAFVLGMFTQALEGGDERVIHVLAVPLLALVAWNVLVLALTVVRHWLPLGSLARPVTDGLLAFWQRRLQKRVERLPRSGGPEGEAERELLSRSLGRYLEFWLPAVTPLAAARLRRLLHAGAGLLVAGVVAGMYLRALGWEYRVTWESTFLGAAAVQTLLETVFAPASALLDLPVPEVAALRSPEVGPAAPWIHLYAATAGLFVVLPRFGFFVLESLRCAGARYRLRIELPESYLRRLRASGSTSERRVEILPYSYRLSGTATEAVKAFLADFFGPRTEVRLRPTLDYGAEEEGLESMSGRCLMVLFNLAQTPESEVHGALLGQLMADLGDGQALVAAIDGAAYRRRLHGDDPDAGRDSARLAERRRGWDRVLREVGLSALHMDLERGVGDEILEDFESVAWPEGSLATLS